MYWEIICYNGDSFHSKGGQQTLTEFIEQWMREEQRTQWDIKQVINHH